MTDLAFPVEWIALAAALFAVAAYAHHRFWLRRLTVPQPYAAHVRIATPDGSAFELRRVSPSVPRADAVPVLLVHGVAIDHRNHDLLPDLSLARMLAAEGRDAWLLTLRTGRLDVRFRERGGMTFAHMVEHDLPLAVAEVRARTGARALDYVGFSMGGMLLYASLGRSVAAAEIRRVVIIGSPVRVRRPGLGWAARWLARMPAPFWPKLPLRLPSVMVAFVSEAFWTPIHHHVCNPDNFAPGVIRRTLMSIHDIPGALCRDFTRWAGHGGPIDVDGVSVEAGLAACAQPVLFLAGQADRVAPPSSVRAAFEMWGRDRGEVDKSFVVLSAEEGCSADYGHGDLAFGRMAPAEVFAPVERFLGR